MNEAEARAYLGAHPALPELRIQCPRCEGTLIRNAALVPGCFDGRPCEKCGGTGEVARDWRGSELQLALGPLGWQSRVTCGRLRGRSHCWAEVWTTDGGAQRPTTYEGQGDTPDEVLSIAAALALQQEARDAE